MRQKAAEVMREDYLAVLQFDIGDEEAQRWGLEPGDTLDVFVEPIIAIPTLYLFGGGRVVADRQDRQDGRLQDRRHR